MIVQNSPVYLPYTELKKYRQLFNDYGYELVRDYKGKNEYYYYDKKLYAMIEHKSEGFCVNIVPLCFNKNHRLHVITYPEITIIGKKEFTSFKYYSDYVENETDCIKKMTNQIGLLKKEKHYREIEKIKFDF